MKLTSFLKAGEGRHLEFKAEMPNPKNIAKTVVAFANNGGGHLVLGIQDKSGQLIGLDSQGLLDLPDQIAEIIHAHVSPRVYFETKVLAVEDKNLLAVEVHSGDQPPYFLKSLGKEKGVYIRVGAINKPADVEFIQELERRRLHISYDEQIATDKSEKDLDLKSLNHFFRQVNQKTLNTQSLVNLKLLQKKNGKNHPTFGGLLLAGKKSLHEGAFVSCALFKGQTSEEFLDRKEIHGPLYEQVEKTMIFLQQHLPLRGKIKDLKREDSYEVPLLALREALINAIIHRDYSITGSNIKVAIFDDVIEFTSPGSLPKSLTLEEMANGRSEIRNKVLARFFKEINYIEQWGSGIEKIVQSCRRQGLKDPQFKEGGLFFQVIISRKLRSVFSEGDLSQQEKIIMEFLERKDFIKNNQAQELLDVSASRIRVLFNNMVEKNLLLPSGAAKARIYRKKE